MAQANELTAISIVKSFNATALLASPGSAVWTPATGNRVRLMRLFLTSSLTGNIVVTDGSSGAILAVVPVIASAMPDEPVDLGIGVLSAAIGNVIFCYNSAGAATISGMVMGNERPY